MTSESDQYPLSYHGRLGLGLCSSAGLPDEADGALFRNHLPSLAANPDLSELDTQKKDQRRVVGPQQDQSQRPAAPYTPAFPPCAR